MAAKAYYTPIAGSRDLLTEGAGEDPTLARFESVSSREPKFLSFADEELARGLCRPGSVSIPIEAFDEIATRLTAEEQAAYLQLWRLAYGAGQNFCRVAKRDLQRRLSLSERHLNRILDGVVRKGMARPLHRNNTGTLYRIRSPDEVVEDAETASDLATRLSRAANWAIS